MSKSENGSAAILVVLLLLLIAGTIAFALFSGILKVPKQVKTQPNYTVQIQNPFDSTPTPTQNQNPFTSSYQNPFENLK